MRADSRKHTFRDHLRESVKLETGSDFGKLSSVQMSFFLLKVYVEQIHNHLADYISDEDFSASTVDGASDLGIDFMYRDGNKVEIFQVKYAKENITAKIEDIQFFQNIFVRLHNPAFRAKSKLREIIDEIDFENDVFQLRYITLAHIDGQAKIQCSAPIAIPPGLQGLEDRVSVDYYDETELNLGLRGALQLQGGIPKESYTLYSWGKTGKRSAIIEVTNGAHRSIIMAVSAAQIVALSDHFKEALFTLNIRNYIGSTQTNKNIIETARTSPEDFFFYNNGVSCLATGIEIDDSGDHVRVDGIQVINGAQTVRALAKVRTNSPDAMLLIRITEVPNYRMGTNFYQNIVRFNNTQNVIKVSDFRSNDPIQNDLKRRFSELHRKGKQVDYIAKRTDRSKPNSLPVKLEDFSKAVYAFLYDPIAFANTASFLFDDTDTGGYRRIFGDGKQTWTVMPENEFRLRAAIWWMSSEFGDLLAEQRRSAKSDEKMALERKWMILYTTRIILEESFGDLDYRDHLAKHYKGDWELGSGTLGEWYQRLYDLAKYVVIWNYKQAAKRPEFVHRSWTRNRLTMQEIAEYVSGNPILKVPPPK